MTYRSNPLPYAFMPKFTSEPPTPSVFGDVVCTRGVHDAPIGGVTTDAALREAFYVEFRYGT